MKKNIVIFFLVLGLLSVVLAEINVNGLKVQDVPDSNGNVELPSSVSSTEAQDDSFFGRFKHFFGDLFG